MNYSKLASKLRSKINKFSGYVSVYLDKTAQRFVQEAIYGIIYSQSVMLTEIGRSIESNISLKKIEERFCRQLKKVDIWEFIHKQILTDASQRVKEDTLLILDLSDLHKKYAKEMEYLAKVRDGSDSGKIVNGYWITQVIGAHLNEHELLPLYQELYSQESPDFKSENAQIIKAINMTSSYCQNKGIWVIDRGGDRHVLFKNWLDKNTPKRFIVRLVGNRNLVYGKKTVLALDLAQSCETPYAETIVKEEYRKEKIFRISYGFKPVRLPGIEQQLYMMVIKGFGKKPMMLLTTEPLRRNRKVLYKILQSYLKRWSVEETIRFVKQTYGLENIRVLKYQRLKNMMAIVLAVFYFIAVKLDTNQKLKIMTGHILKQSKRVFGIPDFKYYALGDGLSSIFKRSPGSILSTKYPKNDPNQLHLGFT